MTAPRVRVPEVSTHQSVAPRLLAGSLGLLVGSPPGGPRRQLLESLRVDGQTPPASPQKPAGGDVSKDSRCEAAHSPFSSPSPISVALTATRGHTCRCRGCTGGRAPARSPGGDRGAVPDAPAAGGTRRGRAGSPDTARRRRTAARTR